MKFLKYIFITIFALNLGNSFAMEEAKVAAQNWQEDSIFSRYIETLDAEIKSLSQYLETLKAENKDHQAIKELIQNIVGLLLKKGCKPEEILTFIQANKEFFKNKILNLDPAILNQKDNNFLEEFFKLLMLNDFNFQILLEEGYRGFLEFKNGKINYRSSMGYPAPLYDAFINAELKKNKEQRFNQIRCLLYEIGSLNPPLSNIINGFEDSRIPQILLDFKHFYLKGDIDSANKILKNLRPDVLQIILEKNIARKLLASHFQRRFRGNPFESVDFTIKDELLGWNILMWSFATGRKADYILNALKDQNLLLQKDEQGRNAIDLAKLFGNYDYIQRLKQYPAIMNYLQMPLNFIDDFKNAYLAGNIKRANAILPYIKDADLQFFDGQDATLGWTKLMWLAAKGKINALEEIDPHEIIFNRRDQMGRNAIDIARLFGYEDAAQLLIKRVQANSCAEVSETLGNPDSSCIIS